MIPHESKARLRQQVTGTLGDMTDQQRQTASRAVCEKLVESTRDLAGIVLGFLPLPEEINLEAYLQIRLETGVAVPIVDWTTKDMHPGRLDGLGPDDFKPDRHGLRTPARNNPIPLDDIELVLVPGLAFDKSCRRLGRGGGFYDRLLPKLPVNTRTIGVCFDEQVVNSIPMDSWDQPVNQILTPTQAFTTR